MAQVSLIALKNAAATVVNYAITRINNGASALFVDRTNAVLAAQSRYTQDIAESATTRKVTGKLVYPTVDPVTGVKIRECLFTYDFRVPLTSTAAERDEICARAAATLADTAVLQLAVKQGEMPY